MAKETYAARCIENVLLTPRVYEARLELVDPPRFAYKAGQFITVPVAEATLRSYSIASPPEDPRWLKVAVDIQPGGPGSRYFQTLQPGTDVKFQGPYGAFVVRDDALPHLLFVGTGTGIAPLRSMILDLENRGLGGRRITLFFGARYVDDLMYHEEFLAMAEKHANTFVYHPSISRPEGSNWPGESGRVTAVIPKLLPNVEGTTAYLCGSKEMLKDVTEILVGMGMDKKQIKREQFW
ncbi:MAG: ferredoxin--NADP reductase [Candidatus Eiseniibacteriota bacterium]